MRFKVHQAHRLACSVDRFGELWTKLKTGGTRLTLHRDGERRPVDAAGVTALLAASVFDGEPFTIATGESLAGERGVELGSRVAQAVALVRGERPLSFQAAPLAEVDWASLKGGNIALIGSAGELGGLLDTSGLNALAERRVLVRRLPADPDHVALVFAASDDAGLRQAVEKFVASAARAARPAAAGRDRRQDQAQAGRPRL